MAIIILNLAAVSQKTEARPHECPHCGSSLLQSWGKVCKPLLDPQLDEVEVRRFRCCECGRTFRHYPEGVGPADQSQRLQQLAAICWVLGLSLRGVTGILGVFGIAICHMTVWRDVRALAATCSLPAPPQGVQALSVDGRYASVNDQDNDLVLGVDMGIGIPVALAHVDEKDRDEFFAWLQALKEEIGVEILVSQECNPHFVVGERLGLDH